MVALPVSKRLSLSSWDLALPPSLLLPWGVFLRRPQSPCPCRCFQSVSISLQRSGIAFPLLFQYYYFLLFTKMVCVNGLYFRKYKQAQASEELTIQGPVIITAHSGPFLGLLSCSPQAVVGKSQWPYSWALIHMGCCFSLHEHLLNACSSKARISCNF